jgi:ubiquitin-like protein Pup
MARQMNRLRYGQTTAKAASRTPEGPKTDEEVNAGIDSLLEEIDQVLEENAVEFLQSYRQTGGE